MKEKKIENIASATITMKIDTTTDLVVWRPTLSALPPTLSPSRQPTSAINNPNVDAVVICLSNDLHVAFTCEGLSTGKHMLVEKPLAVN